MKTKTETISRKQLELDYEFLAEKVRRLEEANAALKQALDADAPHQRDLRAASDRLDWLDENAGDIYWYGKDKYIRSANQDLRAAIDAARKESLKF